MIDHKFQVGDIVKMRKGHPCGGDTWEVLRIGADFRIKCQTCAHSVMIPRKRFERQVKALISTKEE